MTCVCWHSAGSTRDGYLKPLPDTSDAQGKLELHEFNSRKLEGTEFSFRSFGITHVYVQLIGCFQDCVLVLWMVPIYNCLYKS
jgi:hypothetical protein